MSTLRDTMSVSLASCSGTPSQTGRTIRWYSASAALRMSWLVSAVLMASKIWKVNPVYSKRWRLLGTWLRKSISELSP
jgi:hypothetical protein